MTATAKGAVPVVGDRCAPRTFGPISRTDFVKYQGASGDFVPLHHDEQFAQAAGFPTVFSVGMFQASLLATYATDWLGAENIRRYGMRFKEQCWPDDLLVCEGVVLDAQPTEHGQLVTVELTCTRDQGGVAITATAQFLL